MCMYPPAPLHGVRGHALPLPGEASGALRAGQGLSARAAVPQLADARALQEGVPGAV